MVGQEGTAKPKANQRYSLFLVCGGFYNKQLPSSCGSRTKKPLRFSAVWERTAASCARKTTNCGRPVFLTYSEGLQTNHAQFCFEILGKRIWLQMPDNTSLAHIRGFSFLPLDANFQRRIILKAVKHKRDPNEFNHAVHFIFLPCANS